MAKVKFNAKALRKLIDETKQPLLKAKAEEAKSAAESVAPHRTGEYVSQFEIRQLSHATFVVNTTTYANIIEFGAREGNNPRFRPLGRAIDVIRESE